MKLLMVGVAACGLLMVGVAACVLLMVGVAACGFVEQAGGWLCDPEIGLEAIEQCLSVMQCVMLSIDSVAEPVQPMQPPVTSPSLTGWWIVPGYQLISGVLTQ